MGNGSRGNAKQRILFLIPLGKRSASGVRRVLDYIPYLEGRYWRCTVVNYFSPALDRMLHYGSWVKRRMYERFRKNPSRWPLLPLFLVMAVTALLIRRLIDVLSWTYTTTMLLYILASARFVEVVFLQQVTPPLWFTFLLKKLNSRIVFDIDDAVFLNHPERAIAIAHAAAITTPGSHYNADFCSRHNSRLTFLPTCVSVERFAAAAQNKKEPTKGPVRIGWVGSHFTVPYLNVIAEPFSELGASHPGQIILVIVGADKKTDLIPTMDKIILETIPWASPERIPDIVATFDIGIMPLHDSEFEKGKCGLKVLEYMAAGIPAVCSAVGENNFIIQDGVNGFLSETREDWRAKIEQLILDPMLRERIGKAGRDTVRARYSTQVYLDILLNQVLNTLIQNK